jgi:hypothetical protein
MGKHEMAERSATTAWTRWLAVLVLGLGAWLGLGATPAAFAQEEEEPYDPGYEEPVDDPEPEPEPEPQPQPMMMTAPQAGGAVSGRPLDFGGAMQVMRAPGPDSAQGPVGRLTEIFPDASKVWMTVRDTDPVPVERARRGGKWLCSAGQCGLSLGEQGTSSIGNGMLRSIKLQTPGLPLPVSIFGRVEGGKQRLDFDPMLIGRRDYRHICTYKPIEAAGPDGKPDPNRDKVMPCVDGTPRPPEPDSGELTLGLQWPEATEMADFRYLAIVDSCGNARVQPFRRTFTVPVLEVASGGCGKPDGKVLRIFPNGGWVRVTAFNLDAPAAGNVVNATYRVQLPALEDLVSPAPARLLFPDIAKDLEVDCGPRLSPASKSGPGTKAPPGMAPPPGAVPPGATPPPPPGLAGPGPTRAPDGGEGDDDGKKKPSAQPLDHRSVLISPDPLRQGNCRLRLGGQLKRRLVAPLALYVTLQRTDVVGPHGGAVHLVAPMEWIITPSDAELALPAMNFDGESRLRLAVHTDPLSPHGKVTLLSDAGRVSIALRGSAMSDPLQRVMSRRLLGSVTIHTAPLCGADNFETLDDVGSCFRAYLTIPAMLATIQVTRAPWVERPLITRKVLSSVGVALAVDSYDPVQRRAFPIAAQVGGFVQSLDDDRVGLLGYVGIAPTLPVLGEGGNTTSFGFLAGAGVNYVMNPSGPDEGLKPAAFLSFVVQVGQASPTPSGQGPFGSYSSTTTTSYSSSSYSSQSSTSGYDPYEE